MLNQAQPFRLVRLAQPLPGGCVEQVLTPVLLKKGRRAVDGKVEQEGGFGTPGGLFAL